MPANWRVPTPTPADQGNVLTADTNKPNGQAFEAAGGGAITSVFGRTGIVVATSGDYTAGQVTGAVQIGGDLSGAAATPTVAKVNGTSVPATPSTNQAIIATGAATATWQAIANSFNTRTGAVVLTAADVQALFTAAGQLFVGTGSGTGTLLANGTAGQVLTANTGAAPSWQAATGGTTSVTNLNGDGSGDFTTTSATYADVSTTKLVVTPAAAASDILLVTFRTQLNMSANQFFNFTFTVAGTALGNADGLFVDNGAVVSGPNGKSVTMQHYYTVQAGDISGGTVTIRPQFKVAGAATLTVFNGTTAARSLPQLTVVNFKH